MRFPWLDTLSERRLPGPGKRAAATPLSGLGGVDSGSTAGFRGAGVGQLLARTSLLAGLAMISSGCLVTSVPDFQEPTQTPPYLVAATADPPVTQLLELTPNPDYPSTPFRVEVRSEDAGQKVEFKFYYDYGSGTSDAPFKFVENAGELPPGTLADTERKPHSRSWTPKFVTAGCHTLTLMASHAFDNSETSCPQHLADSSQLTWRFLLCETAQPCAEDTLKLCAEQEDWIATCPANPGESSAAGAGAQ